MLEHLIQGQKTPSRMVQGAKQHLESDPIHTRDAKMAQANLVCTRIQKPHRNGVRTVFECPLWRYVSALDCYRGRGSGCSRPECGISHLGGGHY